MWTRVKRAFGCKEFCGQRLTACLDLVWSFVEFAASGWTRNFGFGVFVLCNWGVEAFSTYTLAPYSLIAARNKLLHDRTLCMFYRVWAATVKCNGICGVFDEAKMHSSVFKKHMRPCCRRFVARSLLLFGCWVVFRAWKTGCRMLVGRPQGSHTPFKQ